MNKEKPILLIDTDPGHDDTLALLYLIQSDLYDIRAITTVAGNSTIQNVTNNAQYLLDLLGSDIPLYDGAAKPLERDLIRANVHGKSGLAGAVITNNVTLEGKAVQKIISLIRENPGKISILALGPLTNIAQAFLDAPDIIPLIQQIVLMGGAIEDPGNKNRVAEFNFFVDPEAAQVVFDADVTKTVIPLDVCNTIVLQENDFEKVINTRIRDPLLAMMKHFISGIEEFENVKGALVYDALAAYYLTSPRNCSVESMDIRIETKGELTRGMSVADRRDWGDKNPNCFVVTEIDRQEFVDDFIRTLNKT